MGLSPRFLLAADTSSPLGSVALLKFTENGSALQLVQESAWDKQGSHSEIIAIEAEKLLQAQGLTFSDIDAYACGIGPGSFTGIRVALNFIKSLAYVFQKPVHVMNSLRLLALPALQKHPLVFCMQNAFRDLIYVAQYRQVNGKIIEELPPTAWTIDQFASLKEELGLVVGDGPESFKSRISQGENQDQGPIFSIDSALELRPRSSNFQFNDRPLLSESEILQWFQVKALYVRASEAEEKLSKGGSKSRDQRGEIS